MAKAAVKKDSCALQEVLRIEIHSIILTKKIMRYTGPKLRILRRLNIEKLPGLTTKTIKHLKRPKKQKPSLFAIRLIEKQKLRHNFGISDHQFFLYVKRAQKSSGSTGENLLKLLEMRFDTIVYRLKLAPTITAARQLINHGHFLVNKKKVNIPSYQCQINDSISVRLKSQNLVTSFYTTGTTNQKNSSGDPEKSSGQNESSPGGRKSSLKNGISSEKKLPMHLILDEQRLIGNVSQTISLKDPVIEQYYQDLKLKPLYIIEFFSRKL